MDDMLSCSHYTTIVLFGHGHTTKANVTKKNLGFLVATNFFYPEINKNLMFEKCEFCEKWEIEIANFVENDILKLWILW